MTSTHKWALCTGARCAVGKFDGPLQVPALPKVNRAASTEYLLRHKLLDTSARFAVGRLVSPSNCPLRRGTLHSLTGHGSQVRANIAYYRIKRECAAGLVGQHVEC